MLKLSKYLFNKNTASPVYLIHFVTSLCNASCPHCFIWGKGHTSKKDNDLTIDEIEKITRTFSRDIYNVNLTGGEPFLRDDIPRIIELYNKNAGVKSFLLATNGFFADKILKDLRLALDKNKNIKIVVSLSLDHIKENHDRIRGLPGLYQKVVDLYKALSVMDPKRLSAQVNFTLQRDNYKDIEHIFDHIVVKENIKNFNVTLIRGNTNEKDSARIDIDKYSKISGLIDRGLEKGIMKGFNSGLLTVLNAKNQISRRVVGKILKNKEFISACFAGSLSGVLCSNGDVYPCELYQKKIGNIRDFNYDFQSLWMSREAGAIKKEIAVNKCFCTHECNWTTNILFNPAYIPELLGRFISLKLK